MPPSNSMKIHLHIILPSKRGSSKWFPHQNPVCTSPLLSPTRAIWPAYPIFLDLISLIIFGEQYRPLSSFLCRFLHSPITASLLDPNFFSAPYSQKPLSLRSSLNVCTQVSHPYKTTGKIIILYIIMFKFFDSTWNTKDSALNDSKHFLTSVCS